MIFLKRANYLLYVSAILIVAFIFTSCAKKRYPINTPFVFSNKIELNGNLPKDEKKRLKEELQNYWDDSLKPRHTSLWFGLIKKFKNPPIFDSTNFGRTKIFMNAYLQAQGYYYSTFGKDSFHIIKTGSFLGKQDQLRTTAIITINLGKGIKIDTVSYSLVDTAHNTYKDTVLQELAMQQYDNSYLKQGKPYTKQKISDELDRMVSWFRQNGYYKFTKEHLYALVDTTNENLFKLTLDPIELAKLIAEADKKRRENPSWKIDIKQRTSNDSTRLNKFYVRNTYYYPETKITDIPDSLINDKSFKTTTNKKGDLLLRDKIGLFKIKPLREHTYLRRDSLYKEGDYFKTLNTLSTIAAWQQIDSRIIQYGKDSLDIYYFLVPQKKYQTNYNIEGSRNSGDFTAGNLLGVSLGTTLNNRNIGKLAIQSNTALRAGVELNLLNQNGQAASNLVQTFQFSLSHSYSFPRLIMPKVFTRLPLLRGSENKRTIISGTVAYTERFQIFRLKSANFNYAWEWQKTTKKKYNAVWLWKPLNIELYSIDTLPGLKTLFDANPFLRNSFNTGNVIGFPFPGGGINYTLTKPGKRYNSNAMLRFGIEESGLLTLPFKSLHDKVYQYIKAEAEYKYSHKLPKSEIAYRGFVGIGLPLSGQSLPFFKQYFAGGPNSMRAWGLRQLGLGSSILSDTISSNSFRDRFGDMQLEANVEYRFNIAKIGSFKLASALFADVGNIWNVKKDPTNPDGEFSLNRLYKDIAIGVGTGLRFDFTLFMIRVDFAYKVKDPGRLTNDGWMSIKNFKWTEFRNNQSHTEIKNYAIQLGIGFPF